jgi:hypothetical protein
LAGTEALVERRQIGALVNIAAFLGGGEKGRTRTGHGGVI